MTKTIIRKFIREVLHKQMDIYASTEELAKHLSNYVLSQTNSDKFKSGNAWELSTNIECPEDFKKNTKISIITFNIEFSPSKENKIGGAFLTDKTKLLDNGFYKVFIKINIKIENTNITSYTKEIENVISHELHHAFVHIKTINKNPRFKTINQTKSGVNLELLTVLKSNPDLKEFMEMVYLSLSNEVSARLQETAAQLKHINKKNPTETIEALQQFNPINDARKMLNYSTEKLLDIDKDILQKFVTTFNLNLKFFSPTATTKFTVESFFKYWQSGITQVGNTLLRKILKLVADKHQIVNENVMAAYIDTEVLNEIFGKYLST